MTKKATEVNPNEVPVDTIVEQYGSTVAYTQFFFGKVDPR